VPRSFSEVVHQMYYTYLLELKNGKFYVGFSSDLRNRLRSHKENRILATKNTSPKLVCYIAFKNKKKATDFEKYLKSSSGFAFRNKHLV